MSRNSEEANTEKEKGDSKAVLSRADVQDRNKFKKKNEKRNTSESKDEASSSYTFSSHKSNRYPPKKNIAQNRLKKLRTKLDAEIKLKEKVETVGISRLLDESVVKVGKSGALPNKHKLPKIAKVDNRVNSFTTRNIASERLKKVKKEIQATIETIPKPVPLLEPASAPALEPVLETDSFMEIDEYVSETEEKLPNKVELLQNTQKNLLNHSPSLSSNNDSNFSSVNILNNNDSYSDVIPFINDEIWKIRKEPSYMASHTNLMSDIEMDVDIPIGDLLIVIDTNVLLSHLNIINYLLKNTSNPSLNSCMLVVPWPVIQEIDYAMKKNNDMLSSKARYANNFINDCLKKKHPRFFGQSLIDFKENFKNAVQVDDFILQYCMKFVSFNKKVILLTNDKNLSNKAMINEISVFNHKEFANAFDLSEFF